MVSLQNTKTNSNISVVKIIIRDKYNKDLESSWYDHVNIYKNKNIKLENYSLINTGKSCKLSLIFTINSLKTTVNIFKGSIIFLTKENEEVCKNICLELLTLLFKDAKNIILIFTHNIINKQFKLENPKNISSIIQNDIGNFFYVQTFKSPCICFKQKINKSDIYKKKFNTYFYDIDNKTCVSTQLKGDVLKTQYNIKFKDKFVTFQVFNTKTVVATIFDYEICDPIYSDFLNLIEINN